MNTVLQTFGLSKRFGRKVVLDGLDLHVGQGSIYGLIGQNGAGKTTALKVLLNLQQPTAGRAEIFGLDSRSLGAEAFTQIGYVSENQDLPEWMTVGYLVDYLKPFYPSWDSQLAASLLRDFDLPLDRKLRHLSRGMKMKASLVSSLAYRPRLIVMDEPFTGLDPLVRDEFIAGMLANAEASTILISSHDLAEIETFASHIGYLARGRLQFSEETERLVARFREVEVATSAPAPGNRPDHWLNWQQTENMVRFVESRFDPDDTPAMVRSILPNADQMVFHSMPLRSIFVTLAKFERRVTA